MAEIQTLIDHVEEQNANIKQLADEFDIRTLDSGASRKEKESEAAKNTLFSGSTSATSDDRTDDEVFAELLEQNRINVYRMASAFLPERKLEGSVAKSAVESQKASLFAPDKMRSKVESDRRARESLRRER